MSRPWRKRRAMILLQSLRWKRRERRARRQRRGCLFGGSNSPFLPSNCKGNDERLMIMIPIYGPYRQIFFRSDGIPWRRKALQGKWLGGGVLAFGEKVIMEQREHARSWRCVF